MEKRTSVSSRLAKLQKESLGNIKLQDLIKSPEYQQAVKQVGSIPDSQIDASDIPEWTDEQWRNALTTRANSRQAKKTVSVRLDPEVIDWLKAQGEGRLTRINSILRLLMEQSKRKRGL